MKEALVQKSVLEYLRLKGYFAVRLNNIPTPLPNGGFRPVAMKGLPDAHVDVVVRGLPISVWVEFKSPTGKLSSHQKDVKNFISLYGGFYCIVRSIDDMEKTIKEVTSEVLGRLTSMTFSGETDE